MQEPGNELEALLPIPPNGSIFATGTKRPAFGYTECALFLTSAGQKWEFPLTTRPAGLAAVYFSALGGQAVCRECKKNIHDEVISPPPQSLLLEDTGSGLISQLKFVRSKNELDELFRHFPRLTGIQFLAWA